MYPIPEDVNATQRARLRAKLLSNYELSSKGCWLWPWMKGRYPTTRVGKHSGIGVHRLSLFIFRPDQYLPLKEVLHSCDTPRCYNPDHLFSGTQSDNIKDAVSKGRHYGAAKTHCAKGHEYTPENTYIVAKTGKRQCMTCRRIRNLVSNAFKKFL